MSDFRFDQHYSRRRSKKWLLVLIVPIFLLIAAAGSGVYWYNQSIQALSSDATELTVVTIGQGATDDSIGTLLEEQGLIRSAVAYRLYIRINGLQGQAQAGDYELSADMTVATIVEMMAEGKVATQLVTILPAQRLDQIMDAFIEAGYSESEVENALNPDRYADHPALAYKPSNASLEGYLYPESFQVTPATPLHIVVELSLSEMANLLTPQLEQELLEKYGLSVHEAIILASIVEREVSNPEDRTKVAQVFLKRYELGISLGSDPTALFGAQLFGIEPSVFADTPYNTRIYAGLPPGPINNISAESMQAILNPADTDFLFFVSGDDGNTYFSNTQSEHEALTAQHCIELCQSY